MALITVCQNITVPATYVVSVPRSPYTIDISSNGTSGTVAGSIGLGNNGTYFEQSDTFSFTVPTTVPSLLSKVDPYIYIQFIVTTCSSTAPVSIYVNY